MAVQQVVDGKFVSSTAADSLASARNEKKTGNDSLGKDAFLQLLVAQMKYQDPLEPTSNTEYISQFATFSELEQMQNMSATLELSRATSLVGQTVLLKVTNSSGFETTVQGNVDYVVYENGKAYLSIGGELYSMDDLDTVADEKYLDAYRLAAEYMNLYKKLPELGMLTINDREAVERLDEIYSNMTEYQKSFLSDAYTDSLDEYVKKMKDLVTIAEGEGYGGTGSGDDENAGGKVEGDEEAEE
ncbi:MAG: flagellar hook capping protein [Lachnospiraceae bacterium]|nr:flagellar hook capping protein [Lachnospiraceae bacterium]